MFVFLTLIAYTYVTIVMTLWRKKFREGTMRQDNLLHDHFSDSLTNWVEVKYFGAEEHERGKSRRPLAR